jgi:Flp pilus assembly protein TadG
MMICIGLTLERNLRQSWEKASGPGEAAQSGRLSAGPPFAAREVTRPINSLVHCRRGFVAFEFVLVAPVLLLVLFGILYFGVALNNHLILTAAAQQGAQTLALGRGASTAYTKATSAINSAAANLDTSKITRTVTPCSSDSACSTLLTAGAVASVALTYPCNLTFLGYSFGGSPCTLSAQSAAIVQ